MNVLRRQLTTTLLAASAALCFGLPAQAQTVSKEYTLVEPAQPTENPAKIEVLEFFSYGCPHCADFHPILSAWAAKQPADVVFKRVPVTFNRAAWATIAKLFYALETTGDLAKLDVEAFKAIHTERVSLFDEKVLQEWVVKKGVDPKKFADAYGSFGVQSKVKRAEQMTAAYRVQGVPAIVVDGKFMINGKDFNDTLAIADKLIAKVRAEKGGKK